MPDRARMLAALAMLALAAGLAACGEKQENIDTSAAGSDISAITGDWRGELTQAGLEPFLVAVRIEQPGSGRSTQVAYTGIDCGGLWKLKAAPDTDPPSYLFSERIDQGAGGECKGKGSVTLKPKAIGGGLGYTFLGGGVQSTGTLLRSDDAGIAPVFAQAGVPLKP